MFTGIVEGLGRVLSIEKDGTNIHFDLESPFTRELKVDQSVAHDGVCLTVVSLNDESYRVTAIEETLSKTNLNSWKKGASVNLERCMPATGRFDGHIVQGHVDGVAKCQKVIDESGSWRFYFQIPRDTAGLIVAKGSITVNGISLTVVDAGEDYFSVAIIPYTMEHTNLGRVGAGDLVNIEFDIVGKYVARLMAIS